MTDEMMESGSRRLTFIDPEADPPTPGQVGAYAFLAVVSVMCFWISLAVGNAKKHYKRMVSVRVFFPLVCLVAAMEQGTLVSSGRYYQTNVDDDRWLKFLYVMRSTVAPSLLILMFELTYMVHKGRSVNFCGIFFDEGRRINEIITTPMISFCLRNLIRCVAVVLLAIGIVVNLDLMQDVSHDSLAGRTGWIGLFQDDRPWEEKTHIYLSLLPMAVLCGCSFYLSLILWRYGTQSSMVVHSSILNPWFYPLFGTLALSAGQLFRERWFLLFSNIGLIIYLVTTLLLMSELDKDMVATSDFSLFLADVSRKGDQISSQKQREDESFRSDDRSGMEDLSDLESAVEYLSENALQPPLATIATINLDSADEVEA
eukprot:scaffold421291_cov54-Attheya_sp.AAC.2